jgi:Mce-associated membrane protein
VPVLATLLVLLLAAAAFLWFTRPEPSAIRTAEYAQALTAARSAIVDVTSFDHLTLDDDIEQIRRVTTGDLREEAVAELEENRQQIVEAESIVNTEVIGAGVLRADGDSATVLMVIQATQQSTASQQAQVAPYRVQVELTKESDRWVLSGISGR